MACCPPRGAGAPLHPEATTPLAAEYPIALATTLALELPVALLAYRRDAPARRRVAVALAANLATHGLLWSLWPLLPGAWVARFAAAEVAVLAAEAVAYRRLLGGSRTRALATSALANALSAAAGLLLA